LPCADLQQRGAAPSTCGIQPSPKTLSCSAPQNEQKPAAPTASGGDRAARIGHRSAWPISFSRTQRRLRVSLEPYFAKS
jgi:hypothetical protein